MKVFQNFLIAYGVVVGTIAVGVTLEDDGEPLSEVARAVLLFGSAMMPLVLPGLALYLLFCGVAPC